MDHGFEGVFQLLSEPVGLQDIDNTKKYEKPLSFVVARRYSSRPI